jgi:hypothetical protein
MHHHLEPEPVAHLSITPVPLSCVYPRFYQISRRRDMHQSVKGAFFSNTGLHEAAEGNQHICTWAGDNVEWLLVLRSADGGPAARDPFQGIRKPIA